MRRARRFARVGKFWHSNAVARFVAAWLATSTAFSAVAALLDIFHRIDLGTAIVAIVAIVFSVMLTIQFPADPVLFVEREAQLRDSEGWPLAVTRLVFLREMIQRTLTYPSRTDRALRDLLTDLDTFRGSGRRVITSSARGSELSTELSSETHAVLDGTVPATVASLQVVVNELEAR